jgi:hypothetical protein
MSEHMHDSDQWAKEKIEDMRFDFQEGYWDEMEQLLAQEDKRKRGFIWWWISGGIAAMLIGTGMWFGVGSDSKVVAEITENTISIPQEAQSQGLIEHSIVQPVEKDAHAESNSSLTGNRHAGNQNGPSNSVVKRVVVGSENQQDGLSYAVEGVESHKNSVADESFIEIVTMPYADFSSDQREGELLGNLSVQIDLRQKKPLHSYVQLGGQLGYSGSSEIRGMNGAIGLYFNLEHGQKYLRTGLEMGSQGIAGARFYEERKVYGLGSMVAFNEVAYTQMTQASIPVYVGYSGMKHAVGVGIKGNFLVNARALVKEWNQPDARYDWGYSPGLREFWISGGVDYQYTFSKRWALSAQVEYDVTSRFYNTITSPSARLLSGTIGLKYRLNN